VQPDRNNLSIFATLRTPALSAVVLLMVAMIGGCSIISKPLEQPPPIESTVVETPVTKVEPAPVTPEPEPVSEPVATVEIIEPLKVAIIISRDIENYHRLSSEIGHLIIREGGDFRPFYLYQQGAAEVIKQIKHEQYKQVVAIGLAATRATRMLQKIPVIFCQIYNYQDLNLISDQIKGVSLIPSVEQQIEAWKTLFPNLQRVGVISGEGKQNLIDRAASSAAERGITLIRRTARNDKELWHEFRRLIPQVDGFWLLPDNRILSKRTLRNIADYSTKHTTPLFTVNGLLLQEGAMISAFQVESDIARQVIERLLAIKPDNTIPGPAVVPLEQARVSMNTQVASRFNLLIHDDIAPASIEKWPSGLPDATIMSQ